MASVALGAIAPPVAPGLEPEGTGSARVFCWLALLSVGVLLLSLGSTVCAQTLPAPAASVVGRPVRVVSLCFTSGTSMAAVLKTVDQEGAKGADLIVLPETWRGQDDQSIEAADGPTFSALSALARKHHVYITSPIDAERSGRRYNSALVIDRSGQAAGHYDKVFPYWSEYDLKRPVQPGLQAPVIQTDFGRIGLAICFDVNFPEVWQQLADRGAELVLWPSAYSAGEHLRAYALLHHYYIVTATYTGDCQVYDITGERILDNHGPGILVSRVTLDLDRGIYHSNFNDVEGFVRAHAQSVKLEKFLDREAWYVVRATQPGISVRALAKQAGLEELRDYIARSRRAINERRGQPFPVESKSP